MLLHKPTFGRFNWYLCALHKPEFFDVNPQNLCCLFSEQKIIMMMAGAGGWCEVYNLSKNTFYLFRSVAKRENCFVRVIFGLFKQVAVVLHKSRSRTNRLGSNLIKHFLG